MKTLIGIATFGGAEFTRLALQADFDTVKNPVDYFIVVGKPGDFKTIELCKEFNIPYVEHPENLGFPVSVNDIYDYGWVKNDYDNVIIQGNDVLPYPFAIDALINQARDSDYEWICSTQYDVRNLCTEFPELKRHFWGGDYIFTEFDKKPWEAFTRYSETPQVAEIGFSDVQNLCLYKRSVFDKIGYTDANFYPAYYIDNDYARRGVNAGLKACTMINSVYFHFWSRTIKQGTGGSNNRFFENNRKYYISKWGGDFASETKTIPDGGLKISSRDYELGVVSYWKNR